MRAINATLLYNLFEKPSPQNREITNYYNLLRKRVFPCEKDFELFLRADNNDDQYRYARRIINRMIYESNFPPTLSSLTDVLCVENYSRNLKYNPNRHIGRDHYLHLVYLYILGIYIFFYNSTLYHKLLSCFRYKRQSSSFDSKEICSIKDFISAWKYFTLFHDTGYSVEILSSNNCLFDFSEIEEFENAFAESQVLKDFCIQSCAKIVARLLFVSAIKRESSIKLDCNNPSILSHMDYCVKSILPAEKGFSKLSDVLSSVCESEWVQLECVYSSSNLKSFLSIYRSSDIIVTAFHKSDSTLAFIFIPGRGDAENKLYTLDCTPITNEIKTISSYPEYLFFDDYISKKYDFQYFISTKAEPVISTSTDLVENILDAHIDEYRTWIYSIHDTQSFMDAQYAFYDNSFHLISQFCKNHSSLVDTLQKLYSDSKPLDINTEDLVDDAMFKQACIDSWNNTKYFFQKKVDNINNCLEKMFSDFIMEGKDSERRDHLIEDFFKLLSDHKPFGSLKDEDSHDYLKSLNDEREASYNFYKLFMSILESVFIIFNDSSFYFDYKKKELPDNLWDKYSLLDQKVFKYFNPPDIRTFINDYHIPYNNKYDHGMVSALYYSYISELSLCPLDVLNDNHSAVLSALWNLSINSKKETLLNYNYRSIREQVVSAVFFHNIYPDCFNVNKSYRTKIKDAFPYFCMLCDVLQEWNRPHSITPKMISEKPNRDASMNYDVDISNGTIYVCDTSSSAHHIRVTSNLKKLEEILEHPEIYIKASYERTKTQKKRKIKNITQIEFEQYL